MSKARVADAQVDEVLGDARDAARPVAELARRWDLQELTARLQREGDPRAGEVQRVRNAAHCAEELLR